MVESDDQSKHTAMRSILEQLDALDIHQRVLFIAEAKETTRDRAAAEVALSHWQAESGWTPQVLNRQFPLAAPVLDDVLESRSPQGYPYVARTAALDALRCILVADLAPDLPPGVLRVLSGPVACVLEQ